MPKRKNSDKDDYENLAKKLRKIERKLKKARRKERRSSSSSRSSYDDLAHGNSKIKEFTVESEVICDDELQSYPSPREPTNEPGYESSPILVPDPVPESAPEPASTLTSEPAQDPVPGPSSIDAQSSEPQLHSAILDILGEDPTVPKVMGKEILSALAVRLEHIATSGLTSELRKDLLNKYAVPTNCPLIGAPTLNPEVKAAITESVLKRDQSIESKQKQLAIAISCVTEAISPLMSNDNNNPSQLQLLMDAVRMLCDIQYKHTSIRRGLLLNNLKKDLKDQIQGTKVDSFLFGHNFADNLKTAKAITKSGAELKPNVPKTVPQTKKPGPSGPPKKTFPSTSQHLNWKAPPPGRRSTGTQRAREPAAHRSQPAGPSRKSSQQNQGRSWR
ncbi:uncharacterized protein LOC114363820 [Ostrinia furnacalis]|uniref:uncharacterized protein LOC114363820 n=1 Tax=Ostrinia furnacalis TaxID=93504 RepID=UPI00103BF776|nr:uncharacterized protein LOC114363820 [Ostrinia furnacalis]XP_028175452.1 uncharacterized protein LOC114363820 [Ostrinia furnacalis]